jgi:hypothetical protein
MQRFFKFPHPWHDPVLSCILPYMDCFHYLKNGVSIAMAVIVLAGQAPAAPGSLFLPVPGQMTALSPAFEPPVLKGLRIHPEKPARIDFILDKGHSDLTDEGVKAEANRQIRYFLAGLTIPEKDMWVNLSPYEKDRIAPESFGRTELGRDLLAQDYLLKQVAASVIYPEGAIGKIFWSRVYALAREKYGTIDIPVDTFNKVWIVPARAVVRENGKASSAYVVVSTLKVMLDSDHTAAAENAAPDESRALLADRSSAAMARNALRAIIIPSLSVR